jgi:predicted dehydrogenase
MGEVDSFRSDPAPVSGSPGGDAPGPERPVRVGLVGAGGVGERHARVLTSLPGVDVVAVADHVPERARAVAEPCGAEVFPGAEALVGAAEIEALYVCVPPFAHGEPEMLAVERGLPLFVEKPMAADLSVAEDIGRYVAEAGLLTATGYHWRCLDTVHQARTLLDGRSPDLVAGRWFDKVPPPAWWRRRAGSGGQVVEQATHLLDLARHLAGEVDTVTAVATTAGHCGPEADIDEASAAVLRFTSGAVGTLTASCLFPHKQATVLEVVAPGLALEVSEAELVVHDLDGTRRVAPAVDARVAVDRGFVGAVRGEPFPAGVPYEEALRTHRVACAIATAAQEGGEVRIAA